MKAANPDYKIGDIAKVMSLPLLAYCSLIIRYNRLSGRCGRSWTRKPREVKGNIQYLTAIGSLREEG